MIFDEMPLREVTGDNLRAVIAAGLAEHLFLEYKGELYQDSDNGRKEFLKDICMFANAQGGVLLIGISERRDAANQPTGLPDPDAPLGLDIANPEATLLAHGARIDACIEERLIVESHAIPVAQNRFVLAFRISNSTGKPHCVRHQGHVYFPVRRERFRSDLEIREIKEMAMRVASQLERAETLLKNALNTQQRPERVLFLIGLLPVFFRDFMIEIRDAGTRNAFGNFHTRSLQEGFSNPHFSFDGLMHDSRRDLIVLGRNGLITSRSDVTARTDAARRMFYFHPVTCDLLLRNFICRFQTFQRQMNIPGPYLMRAALYSPNALFAIDDAGFDEYQINAGYWELPTVQLTDIFVPFENIIRPLCDHIHQMFSYQGSPYYEANGQWRGPLE